MLPPRKENSRNKDFSRVRFSLFGKFKSKQVGSSESRHSSRNAPLYKTFLSLNS